MYALHETWELPAAELLDTYKKYKKPLIVNLVGDWLGCRANRNFLQSAGVPLFNAPEKTGVAAAALVHYGRKKLEGGVSHV